MEKDKIEELIEKYSMRPEINNGKMTGRLAMRKRPRSDAELEEVRAAKNDILGYFQSKAEAEENARKEREAKIEAIPGLTEIKKAQTEMDEWHRKFNASFDSESGGGQGIGPMPKYDIEAMRKQYPIADAFLKAEDYWMKSNYELSAIGKRALDAIIDNQEDYENIMAQMEKERKEFSNRHLWD